ncbi:molybdopterin molybdotransferase [Sporobacter termitidis DSM 10068]|uniref:Molybdopterin molybdenumtransferase n=1 Tax=Sporobacter termitidis DSM 10068 TaxID=1123282 RepID=A0A1M5VS60_9FIRM|nr:molybdopterin molybdotransferase MoeA [Sporobacter termitidis]SHH78095.1 molybdopterin molybdotransferase [Sporobacter termitidis DSM 10068]
MLKNIEADAARDMLCALPVTCRTETAGLRDAPDRVLAEDVTARINTPPFDRSPFDGYAFRGEDTKNATREKPAVLKITEELPAGKAPTIKVTVGYAAKILTGAPIPEGANATIKYELTEFTKDEVRIFELVAPDSDIVRAGDDIRAGTHIAEKGAMITAPLVGILASQGIEHVAVYKKPVISILNTGTELTEVGQPLSPAMIYNSNVYTLSGYLRDMGAAPKNAGVVPDLPDAIADRISAALRESDMVVTTGGASVGDYDWAVTSAERLGAEVLFWKINMKPGGSIMAAVKDGKVILGLSGNPGAAVLGLLRIALPYVRKLCGRTDVMPPVIDVFLKEPLTKPSPKLRLLRGRLELSAGRAYFAENEGQSNGAVSSLFGCDLLGEIAAGSPPLPAGTIIKAYRI